MSKKSPLYNQLLIIENTEKNRNKVKDLNKRMKEYGSRWRLSVRYRKPKEGHKYGSGGTLKKENAKEFAVYLNGGYTRDEMRESWSRSWKAHERLRKIKSKTQEELEVVEDYVSSCYNQIQLLKEVLNERTV